MDNIVLLNTKLIWRKHPQNERYYYIEKDERIILLRINNFPDEPLYTLINGLDIMDIEDRPAIWYLEK